MDQRVKLLEHRRLLANTISGGVFNGVNANGVQDSGETGRPGVVVTLTQLSTNLTATAATNASGAYSVSYAFTTGLALSSPLAGGQTTTGLSVPSGWIYFTPSNPDNRTANFGVVVGTSNASNRVSGTVFVDSNANGLRDAAEPGLPGATIRLDGPTGTVSTATTDSSGNYSETYTTAGSMNIRILLSPGQTPTTNNAIQHYTVFSSPDVRTQTPVRRQRWKGISDPSRRSASQYRDLKLRKSVGRPSTTGHSKSRRVPQGIRRDDCCLSPRGMGVSLGTPRRSRWGVIRFQLVIDGVGRSRESRKLLHNQPQTFETPIGFERESHDSHREL